MEETSLQYLIEEKANYERQIKNQERKMKKYSPTQMGYKDALGLKTELERRVNIVDWIIKNKY